jgi:hypothetical protein
MTDRKSLDIAEGIAGELIDLPTERGRAREAISSIGVNFVTHCKKNFS